MRKSCCDGVAGLIHFYKTAAAGAREWSETLQRRGEWRKAERELLLAREWEQVAKNLEFVLLTPHDAAYYARPL